jgi:hypothetical protein
LSAFLRSRCATLAAQKQAKICYRARVRLKPHNTNIPLAARIDELMTQRPPADEINSHDPLLHAFQNHLSAIVGFCDLLLRDIPEGDPKRADILEVYKAGHAAIDLLPQLSTRMR